MKLSAAPKEIKYIFNRYTKTLARPGVCYEINGLEKIIPPLTFKNDPKTYLLNNDFLNKQADLINYADRLLRDNEIDYVVCYGTLLGTLRHNGLIPWDDDADIFIIDINDQEKLFNLKSIIENDGYKLIKVNSYYKLSHASFPLNYPYLDLFQLYTQMSIADIYPIKRHKFEYFEVNIPYKTEKILLNTYGSDPNPLSTVLHDRIFSHIVAWIIFVILGQKTYNLATDAADIIKGFFKLEKCNP